MHIQCLNNSQKHQLSLHDKAAENNIMISVNAEEKHAVIKVGCKRTETHIMFKHLYNILSITSISSAILQSKANKCHITLQYKIMDGTSSLQWEVFVKQASFKHQMSSGRSRIVRGGFVLGKDIETPKSSTEIWCGEGCPSINESVIEVRSCFSLGNFWKKNPWEYYILLYFRALLNNF